MDNYEELLKRLQKTSINDIYYEKIEEERSDKFLITFNESSFDVDFAFNQINSYTNGEPIGKSRRNFQMLKEEFNELGFFPKTLDINHEKVLLTNQEIKLKEEFIKYLSELEEQNKLDNLEEIEKFFKSNDLEANTIDGDLDNLLLSLEFNRTGHIKEIYEDYPELKNVYRDMPEESSVFKVINNEYKKLSKEDIKLLKKTLISELDLEHEIKTLEERKERNE